MPRNTHKKKLRSSNCESGNHLHVQFTQNDNYYPEEMGFFLMDDSGLRKNACVQVRGSASRVGKDLYDIDGSYDGTRAGCTTFTDAAWLSGQQLYRQEWDGERDLSLIHI